MLPVVQRDDPVRAALSEIQELVGREECERALTRLDRLEKDPLKPEERVHALLLRSWVYLELQQFDSLELTVERALSLAPDNHELLLVRAHLLSHTQRERAAIRLVRRVAQTSSNEEHRARASMIIGLAIYRSRHFAWALAYVEKAEAYYRWVQHPLLRAWAAINLALCNKALGKLDVALVLLRGVSRTLPHEGYRLVKLRALINECVVLILLGEIPLARIAAQRAIEINESKSDLTECLAGNNLGHTYRMQGQPDTALKFYTAAAQRAARAGLDQQECRSLFWIGQTYLDARDLQRADAAFARALDIANASNHGGLRFEVLRRQAELRCRQGDRKLAEDGLRDAMRLDKTSEQPRDQALLRRTQLLVADGSVDEVAMQEILESLRGLGDRYEFSRTVLWAVEDFELDPGPRPWLRAAEIEARFYVATMGIDDWQRRLDAATHYRVNQPASAMQFKKNREAFERSQIECALEHAAGVIGTAAQLLGMSRNTLSQKIGAHRLDPKRYARRAVGSKNTV